MSAALPKQADCCNPCDTDSIQGGTGPVGPAGPAGAAGAAGADGVNAFTELTSQFTIPAVAGTQVANVDSSEWASIGQIVFLQGGGYFEVTATPSTTQITLENLGFPSNNPPGTIVPVASTLSPAGERGETGASGAGITLNSISPTTTRGDLMADNGANAPAASVVRQPAGTDGQALTSNSGQPTGLQWNTVLPNVATDNAIVRFDGAAGNPVPGQTSGMVVTDDGALQSSPTGGNARGSRAVDLQVQRAAVTQVASGSNSVIAGGQNNTASGANSAVCAGTTNNAAAVSAFVGGGNSNEALSTNAGVCAGTTNIASGTSGFVGGGNTNLASNTNSAVCAGNGNTASGADAFVGGGGSNSATAQSAVVCAGGGNAAAGTYSAIPGGQNAATDKHGQFSYAAGAFSISGDAQVSYLHWRIPTTDATANVEAFLDGAALRAVLAVGASWAFHMITVGRSDAGVDAMWETKGLIKNNAGAVSLTGAVTQAVIADGTGATWGVSANLLVDADNVNDALRVRVTGAVATNIRWHAHARIVEVGYP